MSSWTTCLLLCFGSLLDWLAESSESWWCFVGKYNFEYAVIAVSFDGGRTLTSTLVSSIEIYAAFLADAEISRVVREKFPFFDAKAFKEWLSEDKLAQEKARFYAPVLVERALDSASLLSCVAAIAKVVRDGRDRLSEEELFVLDSVIAREQAYRELIGDLKRGAECGPCEEHCGCCGEYIGEEGDKICSCDTGSCQKCNGANGISRLC
jgi:hypothetical protein